MTAESSWLSSEIISIISGGIAALSTVLIAILTYLLLFLQRKQHNHDKIVALADFNFALYEKRMTVIDKIFELSKEFHHSGMLGIETIGKLAYEARYAEFLFGSEINSFIEEVRKKAIQHGVARDLWEPLRARAWATETLSDAENKEKEQHLSKMHEIEKWFATEFKYDEIRRKFDKYVDLQAIIDQLSK